MTSWRDSRDVRHRLEIQFTLQFTSPVRFGGEDEFSAVDAPVLRDHDGRPYLPGTTLAGILRNHAFFLFCPSVVEECPEISRLFGCRPGREDEAQSPLIVNNGLFVEGQDDTGEVRDGVAIDPVRKKALDKKKFDQEWLAAGSYFSCSLELLLHSNQPERKINQLLTLLNCLEHGEIRFGARNRKGFGCSVAADWKVRLFDLSSPSGMLQWMGAAGGGPEEWPSLSYTAAANVGEIVFYLHSCFPSVELSPSAIPELRFEVDVSCPGSLLIGSDPGGEDNAADVLHLHRRNGTNREPIIPGTSLAGVMRHRALKIACTLANSATSKRANQLVNNLFGSSEVSRGTTGHASRVWFEEAVLSGDDASLLRHSRTRIDRWRGSSFKHLLFNADPVFNSKTTLCWQVRMPLPDKKELALLLAVLQDLFEGDLPVGAQSGIGRGILLGKSARVFLAPETAAGGGIPDAFTLAVTRHDGDDSIELQGNLELIEECFIELTSHLA